MGPLGPPLHSAPYTLASAPTTRHPGLTLRPSLAPLPGHLSPLSHTTHLPVPFSSFSRPPLPHPQATLQPESGLGPHEWVLFAGETLAYLTGGALQVPI